MTRLMSTKHRLMLSVVSLVLLGSLLSCNSDLNRSKAEELIRHSAKFTLQSADVYSNLGRYVSGDSDSDVNCWYRGNDPDRDHLLQSMGYIEVKPLKKRMFQVSLTAKGRQLLADQKQKTETYAKGSHGDCEYEQASLIVATREMVVVTGVTEGESVRTVNYIWRWNLTAFGKELFADNSPLWHLPEGTRGSVLGLLDFPDVNQDRAAFLGALVGRYTGAAILRMYDDGWRVEQIE
jgi:hypothetical protein